MDMVMRASQFRVYNSEKDDYFPSSPFMMKRKVWDEYHKDKFSAVCSCCKIRPIHFSVMQIAYYDQLKRNNERMSNLRPVCKPCKRTLGKRPIKSYRSLFTKMNATIPKRKMVLRG